MAATGLRKDDAPYCPESPTPKQQHFLGLDCHEAFYGGAAGGGKSSCLLMAALQHVDTPGYAALLLRRSYADLSLPGALMDRADTWLRPTKARWRALEKTWEFPSGASITFGYLENERDKYRYQGAEFQFIAFDELTQFAETQYRYLISRLRRKTGVEVPLRIRSASNPGGVGHEWVKQRFITEPEDRVFVPARLEDNPHLDLAEYEKSLAQLDHVTRAQLRMGDWEVTEEGSLFRRGWFLPALDVVPETCKWVRYWDLAATEAKAGTDPDYTAGVLVGRTPAGLHCVADVKRVRLTPAAVEALIRETAEQDRARFGPVPIWMEQEPGASGVTTISHYERNVMVGFEFRGIRSTGPKAERARPPSAQAEAGNVKILSASWNSAFLDELCVFPTEGAHDDQVDAFSGAMERLATRRVLRFS